MENETFKKSLPVVLTDAELLAYGNLLSADELKRHEIEEELKMHNECIKSSIKALALKILSTSRIIEERSVDRQVVCHYEMDKAERVKRIIRDDTGEIVDTEPMTTEDFQKPLFAEAKLMKFAGQP